MIVVLLGPPGAGKGTQCKRIIEKYKLAHLSSGDILRAERTAGSDLGKEAQGYMDAGDLVPDELIIKMMVAAINKADGGCVLDGFPRTVVQGSELDKALTAEKKKIDAIVSLEIADEVIEKRLTGRRSCPVCGAVYHLQSLKPKVEGFCDKCPDQELVQRTDDKPEVVKNRLETYHAQTAAVIGYYASTGHEIFTVSADAEINDITADILSQLDKVTA